MVFDDPATVLSLGFFPIPREASSLTFAFGIAVGSVYLPVGPSVVSESFGMRRLVADRRFDAMYRSYWTLGRDASATWQLNHKHGLFMAHIWQLSGYGKNT